ncbi:MAG TPA: hypothetical protein VGG30_05550 [Pirellulales bacterium]|jgi:hypothetical protein
MRILCLVIVATLLGCSGPPPPAVYIDHLADAIQTAIEHKDARWIDQYANRARACHKTGQLTDQRFESLEGVLQKARAGDWTGAAQAAEAFRQ